MEKLTSVSPNGEIWLLDSCGRHHFLVTKCDSKYSGIKKLSEYEYLEEQGKLLKLPCAVGDTVYEVQDAYKRIQEYIVTVIHISNHANRYNWELKDGRGIYSSILGFDEYAFGKTVFLSREEAEAALKALES